MRRGHKPDYIVLIVVGILVVFGLVMLASASSELGKTRFNDSYYYLKHQIISGLIFGIIGFIAALYIPYRWYQKFALPMLLVSLGIFSLVFTSFGYTAGGAGRWLQLGSLTFQPGEILKITFIIYLAAWLANIKNRREKHFYEGFLPFLIICGLVGGLLIAQPATSTVVILIGAGFIVYFASGAKLRYIGLSMLVGILGLGIIILASDYRRERVLGFLNYKENTQSAGYHLNEALLAIGTGGLTGVGFGKALQKTGQLPASINDSIFAIIASELGFIGAGLLVALFAILTIRLFMLGHQIRDRFGKLVLTGFASIIGLQSIVNMGAISGLLPLTGVPLPFISYGGTALVVFLIMMGIAENMSKYA